ncbi:MAG: sugar phosphate isomerase/epimerase [Oscillospiraceae bacterium]|nr:sugar phosphate isomerase/epimerase [Oscillospiraceae bacterium]
MKIGLYSISCSGVWFKDRPPLTVEEFVDTAKKYGYEGVELDLKRPHGSPLDLDAKRCKEIAAYVADKGLIMSGAAANNNFASIVDEELENELLFVREQLRVCKDLGAPVLRIFAAWNGIVRVDGIATYERTRNRESYGALSWQKRRNVTACLKEVVKYAEDAGVVLALQNHQPVINEYQDMLSFIKQVDSPWLKASFDAPCCGHTARVQSDAYMEKAVRDVGDLQVISHANAEFAQNADGSVSMINFGSDEHTLTNYPVFIKTLKAIGYEGFVNFEFCHMPEQNGKIMGYNDYIEDQIRLAQIYFKNLVDN